MDFRFAFRLLLYKAYDFIPFRKVAPSSRSIDVIIPIVKKDLPTLPLCIEGVRRCVKNKVSHIYIVAPSIQEIKDYCDTNDLIYVDENSVVGITSKDINLVINGNNRSGWIFQQLLKLSGTIGTEDYYLTVDADHVLIKEHVFLTDKRETVYYMSKERHQCYYDNMRKLCNVKNHAWFSYVDHKMLFSKKRIEELHSYIEKKSGRKWIDAILNSLDRNETSAFSEFELYGNFCNDGIKRPWKQIVIKKTPQFEMDYDAIANKYKGYMSVTIH